MRIADFRSLLLHTIGSCRIRQCRRATLVISLTLVVLGLAACIDRADRLADDEKLPETERSAEYAHAAGAERSLAPVSAPDVEFRTLRGDRLALRDFEGPSLINFWSTSCAVCLHEMPALAQIHADFADRGFTLVSVAMPYDRPDTVLELVEARGWTHPVALDIDGVVLAAFEPVPGTPTSYFIDAQGEVIARHVGATDIDALRTTLEGVLSAAGGPDNNPMNNPPSDPAGDPTSDPAEPGEQPGERPREQPEVRARRHRKPANSRLSSPIFRCRSCAPAHRIACAFAHLTLISLSCSGSRPFTSCSW